MPSVYLLFGSNVGNRVTNIRQAILSLVDNGLELLQVSHFYETEPWGIEEQQPFLNVAAKFKTKKKPHKLLQVLKEVELEIGRLERGRWQQREIDIDIIFYGKQIIQTDDLTVPHLLLIKRNFALEPLKEIAPRKKHPILGLTVREMAKLCTDNKTIERLKYKPKL